MDYLHHFYKEQQKAVSFEGITVNTWVSAWIDGVHLLETPSSRSFPWIPMNIEGNMLNVIAVYNRLYSLLAISVIKIQTKFCYFT